jgi:hypothetical protein
MPNSMPPMIVAPERAHRVDVVDADRVRTLLLPAFGPQDDECAENERERDRHWREQARLDRTSEQQSENGRGQECNREIDDESLRGGFTEQSADDSRQLRAEFPAHRENRARLDHDLEYLGLLARVVEQRARDDQVACRGDWQEFGQALDNAEDHSDEQRRLFQGDAVRTRKARRSDSRTETRPHTVSVCGHSRANSAPRRFPTGTRLRLTPSRCDRSRARAAGESAREGAAAAAG